MEWIGTRKDSAPFFAWIATNAPHEPLQVPEEYEGKYRGKVGADEARFFGMIANIDDNMGRLLDKLDEWGIARDTLVIMMGDNGGKTAVRIHNAGMRGAKGSAWQGGIRTFSFWRWPGTLEPAAVSALAAHIDVFPTLAALAGAKPDPTVTAGLEGRSLLPLLQDSSAPWPDRTLFTHVGRWEKREPGRSSTASAVSATAATAS
jgi:arylsulfatase A-like enzyme